MNLCEDCRKYAACIDRLYDMQPVEQCTAYRSKTGVDFILEQTEGNHGVVIKRFNKFGLAFDAMINAAELAKEDGDLLVVKGKTTFVYKSNGDVIRWDIFGRPEASE